MRNKTMQIKATITPSPVQVITVLDRTKRQKIKQDQTLVKRHKGQSQSPTENKKDNIRFCWSRSLNLSFMQSVLAIYFQTGKNVVSLHIKKCI